MKTKGAASTAPSKKQTKKATKCVEAFEQLEQDLDDTKEEESGLTCDEAFTTTQEDLEQRMDIMTMLLDFSRNVQVSEAQQKRWTTSSLASPYDSHAVRRRARLQTTPTVSLTCLNQ